MLLTCHCPCGPQLQESDLDERNIAELRKFDAAVALEILENYSHADFSTVRNRRAYLAGAIKRKANSIQPKLHPDVQQKLKLLTASGGCCCAVLCCACSIMFVRLWLDKNNRPAH